MSIILGVVIVLIILALAGPWIGDQLPKGAPCLHPTVPLGEPLPEPYFTEDGTCIWPVYECSFGECDFEYRERS